MAEAVGCCCCPTWRADEEILGLRLSQGLLISARSLFL